MSECWLKPNRRPALAGLTLAALVTAACGVWLVLSWRASFHLWNVVAGLMMVLSVAVVVYCGKQLRTCRVAYADGELFIHDGSRRPIAVPVAIGTTIVFTYFLFAFTPLREDTLVNGGFTVLGVAWVAGTLAFAIPILRHPDFRTLVLAVVVSTVAMDVGAFTVGRTWGRRALAPVLSPNKSVEGLMGGIVLAMGAAVGMGALVETFDMMAGAGIGLVVAVFAPLGDLAESMVKRSTA